MRVSAKAAAAVGVVPVGVSEEGAKVELSVKTLAERSSEHFVVRSDA